MSDKQQIRDRVEASATWYKSREDFDSVLIHYSWLRMKRRCGTKSALELGSADGLMTEELIKHFERVAVVEGAQKNIDWVRAHFPNVQVHHCLFEEFETHERFQDIIAARVLEHLDDPVAVLKQMKNHLAPGGQIHIVVPNADSMNRKLGLAMGMLSSLDELTERDRSAGHVRVYRKDLLTAHVRAAGLRVVELTGTFLKPVSNAQMLGWDRNVLEGLFSLADELPLYCTELYAVCCAE
jgi:2-polyprenyl-3-methyl-5-hydroxy-6-metoxy-1,4-benzoquinol methylase